MICSSFAGMSGYPFAAPYAATKAAIIGLLKSIQHETQGSGVDIKVSCPGFIDTDIFTKSIKREVTDAQIEKSLRGIGLPSLSPKKAAQEIIRQSESGKSLEVFPTTFRILSFLRNRFPAITNSYVRKLIKALS